MSRVFTAGLGNMAAFPVFGLLDGRRRATGAMARHLEDAACRAGNIGTVAAAGLRRGQGGRAVGGKD